MGAEGQCHLLVSKQSFARWTSANCRATRFGTPRGWPRAAARNWFALYANWFDAPPYFTEGRIEELTREFRDSQTEAEQSLAAFVKSTLGAPRRTFFDGLVLGTTTLRAVRHAPWPVQTVGERVR